MAALANEQAIVAKATLSMVTKVRKRGARNLETALRTLSTPFVPQKKTAPSPASAEKLGLPAPTWKKERSFSVVSEVSLPSALESLIPEEAVSSAEELVINARRKHAILLGIIVKLQALCRRHLVQTRRCSLVKTLQFEVGHFSTRNDKHAPTAITLQAFYRSISKQRKFIALKQAVTCIQARHRCYITRSLFQMLLSMISNVQAAARGNIVRKWFRSLCSLRMQAYREHIFYLWLCNSTPLTYRTKFWPIMQSNGIVRLAIAERELARLWTLLKVEPQANFAVTDALLREEVPCREAILIGSRLGVSNRVVLNCIQVFFIFMPLLIS
jgi:IQ calmodulin-binding motif